MLDSLNGSFSGEDAAILGFIGGVLLVALAAMAAVNVLLTFFLWNSYRVVPTEHQSLPSALVWLCAIPCLGSIMLVVCSVMVPQSFQAAFRARGRSDHGDCGFVLGLIGSIGMLAGGAVPLIGGLVVLGAFVVFIVFLAKLHGCSRALRMG